MIARRKTLSRALCCALVGSALTGGAVAISGTEAVAQTFFDRLFKTRAHKEHLRKVEAQRKRKKVSRIRVSSPKTYTYRPDMPKLVSLAGLAEVEVAELVQPTVALPLEVPFNDPAYAATAPGGAAFSASAEFSRARTHLTDYRLRALPEVAAALKGHYKAQPSFIWVTDGRPNGRARAALAVFAEADTVGLSPDDYAVEMAGLPGAADIASVAAPSADNPANPDRAAIDFEMRMSAAALTYALDARRGRVDPNRLSGYHDLPRHAIDLSPVLETLGSAGDVAAALDAHHPVHPAFAALKADLAALRGTQEEAERVEIAPKTFLKPGKSSQELANVVAAVRLNGSDALKADHAATLAAYDGTELYSDDLVALIKDFQAEKKLTADGIIGKNTIRALVGVSNADKIRKIEFAMERLRWMPREFGRRHVFINQPAYIATYRHEGQEPLSMRAVVGKRSNQTSFFYDTIETVEYNPYWGVPRSIIVNEFIPKLSADPSYLDRQGYEVSTVRGQRVSSTAVDWYSVATGQQSINVRQPPGSKNALGELKIMFPNKHAIYMHDTPARNLFNRDRRAFSHGCIRLQHPRLMAAAVLQKDESYIASRIAVGKNDVDKVAEQIPVYSAYFTAWPKDDAGIGFYDDVYGRDSHLAKAIERTSAARHGNG